MKTIKELSLAIENLTNEYNDKNSLMSYSELTEKEKPFKEELHEIIVNEFPEESYLDAIHWADGDEPCVCFKVPEILENEDRMMYNLKQSDYEIEDEIVERELALNRESNVEFWANNSKWFATNIEYIRLLKIRNRFKGANILFRKTKYFTPKV